MVEHQAGKNTDRELWRERKGDYFGDSIHVTATGAIGINCGGTVIIMTLRGWHKAVDALERLHKENEALRGDKIALRQKRSDLESMIAALSAELKTIGNATKAGLITIDLSNDRRREISAELCSRVSAVLDDTASTAQSERARIRREALEEAAKVADKEKFGLEALCGRDTTSPHYVTAAYCESIADDIRSLAEEEGR